MRSEIAIAALILAGVSVTKCTPPAEAKPVQPAAVCRKLTAIMQTTDADGLETVTTLPFYSCSDNARPHDRSFRPVCYVGDNPFAELYLPLCTHSSTLVAGY